MTSFVIASDIHGKFDEFSDLIAHQNNMYANTHGKDVDCILLAGDLTSAGGMNKAHGIHLQNMKLSEFLENISHIAPVLYITGNHDIDLHTFELARHPLHTCKNITDTSLSYNNMFFNGLNMSTADSDALATSWDRMTQSKEAEEAYYDRYYHPDADIIISHCPPSSPLAMWNNKDIGSSVLTELITEHQPELVICGHVHECSGQFYYIGETLCINTAVTAMTVYKEKDVWNIL